LRIYCKQFKKEEKKKGTVLNYRKQDLKQLGAALLEHSNCGEEENHLFLQDQCYYNILSSALPNDDVHHAKTNKKTI
jgi:hypothetical protein